MSKNILMKITNMIIIRFIKLAQYFRLNDSGQSRFKVVAKV
jgi:hypothetical protein